MVSISRVFTSDAGNKVDLRDDNNNIQSKDYFESKIEKRFKAKVDGYFECSARDQESVKTVS